MSKNLRKNVNTLEQAGRLNALGVTTPLFGNRAAYWTIHTPKVPSKNPTVVTLSPDDRWPNYSSYSREQRLDLPAFTLAELFVILGADKFGILPDDIDLDYTHHLDGHSAANMTEYYTEILILLLTANKITPAMVLSRLEAYYGN